MSSEAALFGAIFERLQEINRRIAGSQMLGKVTHVDAEKRLARIEIGKDDDGNPVLSPWRPYTQTSGALKLHNPPSVGQPMKISAANGDIQQGYIEPLQWSAENPSPSDNSDEHVLTFGNVAIRLRNGELLLVVAGVSYKWAADGFHQVGGKIQHNEKIIDDTHTHGGIMPGPASTAVPD